MQSVFKHFVVLKESNLKKIKILNYLNESRDKIDVSSRSLKICLEDYFNKINKLSDENLDTKTFWCKHESEWPELSEFAKFVLNVPATSAPVERIFSVGGSILRPSRRCLNDNLFEKLIFLKCNLNLFLN